MPEQSELTAASEIAGAIKHNISVAPSEPQGNAGTSGSQTPPPAAAAGDWRSEPLSNFQLDSAGKVELDALGNPRRREGKPRKPKRGDLLASGQVYGGSSSGDSAGSGTVDSILVEPTRTEDQEPPEQADPGRVELTEQAGKVFVEGLDSLAASVAGEKAKLSTGEKSTLSNATGKIFSGLSVSPWSVLLAFGLLWILRVIITAKKDRKEERGTDASVHRGNDAVREVPAGQVPRVRYPA